MKVMDFLYVIKDKMDWFKLIWYIYFVVFKCINVVDLILFVVIKNEVEEVLYGVMCCMEWFNSGIIDDFCVCDV